VQTSEVKDVGECERWRLQILKEVGRKVTQIQNSSLGEKAIRELNDEINRLLREKARWERRILELGGPNYFAGAARAREEAEADGVSVLGQRGEYKYFGEARNLPEVRELLRAQQAQREAQRLQRKPHELHKGLDADYYGFQDDADLLPLEAAQEQRMRHRAQSAAAQDGPAAQVSAAQPPASKRRRTEDEGEELEPGLPVEFLAGALAAGLADDLVQRELEPVEALAAPQLPSREEIETALLEKRREELLRRFVQDEAQILSLARAAEQLLPDQPQPAAS
jgi:pre-mRNA-splicing factor ISY1